MITLDGDPSKVTSDHQAKLAYVYVRQSTPAQATRHKESTDLQYELVERAVRLGWPRERIRTIDDDLGQSGTSAETREGFQQLLAEIGLTHVGLVLSMDASRLARNNSDWYQLLEVCSVFGTLVADSERLYDPRTYHDRLLLGLSGMMAEAELHHLRLRLHAGARHKAERGELHLPLAAGLARTRSGEVILNPDEEVQGRIRLVFKKFQEVGSARAVTRYLRRHQLPLPARLLQGPAPHEIVWPPATSSLTLRILKNPAYAGAYVYGQSVIVPARRKPGHPHTGIVRRPMEDWPVVLHNRYPAYITWEVFTTIQKQLQHNQTRYHVDRIGPPRRGQALLQGIAVCAHCGARMRLHYSGPHGEFPVYTCTSAQEHDASSGRCQEVRALGLDAEVERLLLEALAPDRLHIALAALEQVEHEDALLRRQWQLRRERARFEAERARRQYDIVEPENRLVARTLEGLWEEKLRAAERVEHEYETWVHQHQLTVTPADRQEILALAEDLPAVWTAATTTSADRKRILRLLVRTVILDQHREPGKVWFQINWHTGAISEHWLIRTVQSYGAYARRVELERRIRELNAAQMMDAAIAAVLNAEGFRTARGGPFTGPVVWLLRKKWSIVAIQVKATPRTPAQWEDGRYSVHGAAAALGVYPGTVHHWLRVGRLQGTQVAKGMPWQISLSAEQITALRAYVTQARPSRREA
jgi:DNA invertase Pin-like site-specific DNA recombinase